MSAIGISEAFTGSSSSFEGLIPPVFVYVNDYFSVLSSSALF